MSRLFEMHKQVQLSLPAARDQQTARRHYTLADKLAIVRESQLPGVSQAFVSRKHNLGKNVLWTWRKSLAGFSLDGPAARGPDDQEVQNLRQRIGELERLLGQKAFEIEMLRNRLQTGLQGGLRSMGTSPAGPSVVPATETDKPRPGEN